MGRYPFQLKLSIPSYDCDCFSNLSASSALSYAQIASTAHLSSLGITHDILLKEGMFFALVAVAARFERAPKAGEEVLISTVPVASHGAQSLRESVMHDKDGNILIEFQASWALVNVESGRALRASALKEDIQYLKGEWTPFIDPSKMRLPEASQKAGSHVVKLSDIDLNHHMNNAAYADVMLDCFAGEYISSAGIDRLMIRYRRQVRIGETIELSKGFDGQLFSIRGHIDGNCCFEGAFSLKGLETR